MWESLPQLAHSGCDLKTPLMLKTLISLAHQASPQDKARLKKIRQIITDYIDEIIEEEAPHLVAQALARALAPPSSEHPSKKG